MVLEDLCGSLPWWFRDCSGICSAAMGFVSPLLLPASPGRPCPSSAGMLGDRQDAKGVSLEYRTDPSASQLVPVKIVLE